MLNYGLFSLKVLVLGVCYYHYRNCVKKEPDRRKTKPRLHTSTTAVSHTINEGATEGQCIPLVTTRPARQWKTTISLFSNRSEWQSKYAFRKVVRLPNVSDCQILDYQDWTIVTYCNKILTSIVGWNISPSGSCDSCLANFSPSKLPALSTV